MSIRLRRALTKIDLEGGVAGEPEGQVGAVVGEGDLREVINIIIS